MSRSPLQPWDPEVLPIMESEDQARPSTSITCTPRYVPQWGQTWWGRIRFLHRGHGTRLGRRSASCARRIPRRVRVTRRLGNAPIGTTSSSKTVSHGVPPHPRWKRHRSSWKQGDRPALHANRKPDLPQPETSRPGAFSRFSPGTDLRAFTPIVEPIRAERDLPGVSQNRRTTARSCPTRRPGPTKSGHARSSRFKAGKPRLRVKWGGAPGARPCGCGTGWRPFLNE
jgi:hypothetical protein